MSTTLVIFGRLPVPGKVKTRLAVGIGPERACAFYSTCCEHILHQSSQCEGAQRVFFFSNETEREPVTEWIAGIDKEVELASQLQVPDLGERMVSALGTALQQGACKAVIIGTDIPDLTPGIIQSAFQALDNHDVVIGPAADGGYYLLGLKQAHAELFQGIEWSTGEVLGATLANAKKANLDVAPTNTLPVLRDIDTVADLQEWMQGASSTHPLHDPVKGYLAPNKGA